MYLPIQACPALTVPFLTSAHLPARRRSPVDATADGEFGGAWGGGYVDPPAGTEDCPIAGTNPTAARQQEAEESPTTPFEPVADFGGTCGDGVAICPGSQCCSQYGYCGETDAHCGDGCQSSYGSCS